MDEEDDVSRSDPAIASVEGEATAEPTAEFAVLKPVSYEIEGVACVQNNDVTNEHVDVSPKHVSDDANEVDEQVNDDVNVQVDDSVDKSIGDSIATISQVEENETAANDHANVDVRSSEQVNDDSVDSADDAEESYLLDETSTPPNSSLATSYNETNTADEEMDVSADTTKLKRRYQRKVYRNVDPSGTPGESRYGRVRKPKLASDFISVDRKSFAVLNSSSYKHVFAENEEPIPPKVAKVTSPVKVPGHASKGPGRPRKVPGRGRGRPRKIVPNVDNVTEIVPKIVDSTEHKSDVDEEHSVDDESSINSINVGTMKTYSKLSETSTVSTPEASQDGQEMGEKTTTPPQVNYPELDWRVGDIAWARIGCYPYWPSIVTLEYGSSIYVKPAGKRGRLAVHVQFFGDRGRRSWVLTSSLIKYKSKEQFMELKRQYKKDKFRFKNFNVFRMKDLWNKSISEADTILKLPYEERIQHYQTMYPVSEETYVAELANASKVKPSIRKLRKNMKHRRRGRRKITDGDARYTKRPVQPASADGTADGTNENLTISTDSMSSTALDDASKPLKKRKRKPLDEHIKKRRAFERRLKKVLQDSEHVKPKNSDRQGNKNSAKSLKMKNARFNALLKSGGGTNVKLPPSSADLSHLSEEKKSALSVYDFESDEETEVFMSYNSRFSSQVLPRIEKGMDSSENDDATEVETEKVDEKAPVETESTARAKSAEVTDNAEDTKRTEVKRRGRGRPKGSKNSIPSAGRRRPKQVGQVAGMRRRKGASLFVRRKQPAGSVKLKSNGGDPVGEMKESPVGLVCGIEDLQKINKLISMEDEQSSDDDEYKSTEEEKLKSSSSDKTPSTCVEKRSSLFAGMKNERVCCICEKAGDTVRCRGPCSGTYHIECERKLYATDVAEEVTPKPRRGRKPRKSVLAAKDDELNVDVAKDEAVDESGTTKTTDESEGNGKDAEKMAEATEEKVEESKTIDSAAGEATTERMEVDEEKTPALKTDEASETPESNVDTEKKIVDKVEGGVEAAEKVEDERAEVKTEETNDEEAVESCSTIVEPDAATNSVEFRCKKCTDGEPYPCYTCGRVTQEKTGETERFSCCLQYCGRVYHKECLKAWPQAMWVQSSLSKQIRNGSASTTAKETLLCPQHYCHTCISEDPAFLKNKENKARLVRCIRCPTAYHKRVHCIPAGTEILSLTEIICPRHYEPPPGAGHCNTNWCCICCIGGSLICCEDCPMAFHAECLNLPPEEYEGRYICEDCQNGRFLLYGEVAWVKLGHYRWWPAQILYPSQVPDNIRNIMHRRGEFAVRFFGSNNYNWISRGRSFVYQDGDSGKNTCGKRSVDVVFVKALEEAKEAYQLLRIAKAARDKEHRAGLKPPKYGRISANKPIGNVRIVELNTSNITACECDPKSERPCAPDSDCLNRMLLVECNPAVCVAGERCLNQAFEKRVYPPLMPFKTEKRGWGLKALVDLKKGDFIIEYVGEMITEEEYQRRLNIMHQNQEVNYYFLTIDKDRMLDAGPRGNVSRFMNHSCDPNCETQKWTVNGDTRVGLFALKDVPANTELTFNYNLVSQGNEMKPCHCGSDKCAGFIGLRPTKQNGSIMNNDDETRKKSCDDNRKKSVENGNGDARKITGRKRGRPRLDSKPSTPVPSSTDESGAVKSADHEQTTTPGEPPKKRKRFRKPSIVQNATAEPNESDAAVSVDENSEPAVGTVPVSDLPPKKRECAGKASETSTVNDGGADTKKSTEDANGEKATAVETQPPVKRGRGRPKKTMSKTSESGNTKAVAGRRLIRKKMLMKKRRVAAADAEAKPLTNGEKTKKVIKKKKKTNVQKPETKSEQEKQESLFRMLKQRIDNKFIEMSSIDGLEKKNRISDANGGYVCEKRVSDVEKTTEKRSDRELQDTEVSRPNKIEKDAGKNASEVKPSLNNIDSNESEKRKSNSITKKIIKKPSVMKKIGSSEKRKESSTKESGKKPVSLVKRVLNEKRSEPTAITKPNLKKKKIILVKKKKLNPSVRTKQEESVVIKKVKKDDVLVKKKVIRLVGSDGKHLIRKKKKLMTNKTSAKSNGPISATVGADSVEWKPAKVEEEKVTADEKTKIEDVTMEYTEESETIDSDTFIEEYHPEDFPPADRVEENSVETAVVENTNRKMESDDSFVSCEMAPEDYKEKEMCDKDDDDVASDDEIVNLEVEEVDD